MTTHAGSPLPARLPAPPFFQFPASYRHTQWYAPLAQHDAEQNTLQLFGLAAADLGRPIPILAFCADFPICWAKSRYTNFFYSDAMGMGAGGLVVRDDFDEAILAVGGNAAPWNLLLTGIQPVPPVSLPPGLSVQVGADYGQAISGASLTNLLPSLVGYPFEVTPEDLALVDDMDAAKDLDSLRVRCEAQGGVKDARGNGELIEYSGTGTVTPVTAGGATAFPNRVTVILDEIDYTAAMRANENRFTLANGTVVQIVGLFAQNPAP